MTAFRVAELTGFRLDAAVAMAEGRADVSQGAVAKAQCDDLLHYWYGRESEVRWPDPPGRFYSPSRDWKHGGPIIERELIDVDHASNSGEEGFDEGGDWCALAPTRDGVNRFTADTPLVAAMRAYVASKLGETIELPD